MKKNVFFWGSFLSIKFDRKLYLYFQSFLVQNSGPNSHKHHHNTRSRYILAFHKLATNFYLRIPCCAIFIVTVSFFPKYEFSRKSCFVVAIILSPCLLLSSGTPSKSTNVRCLRHYLLSLNSRAAKVYRWRSMKCHTTTSQSSGGVCTI